MDNVTDIGKRINLFLKEYTEMDIEGIIIRCPYWMNILREGRVSLCGFEDGKGRAEDIQKELISRLHAGNVRIPTQNAPYFLQKFAKRERIGIDCSGLVYRVVDELVRCRYRNTRVSSLEEIFPGGITRTNADRLTSSVNGKPVFSTGDVCLGDLIRMLGGKHIAIVVGKNDKEITYAHASSKTMQQGVHSATIKIVKKDQPLESQIWSERLKNGESFVQKYMKKEKGDAVIRLNIF